MKKIFTLAIATALISAPVLGVVTLQIQAVNSISIANAATSLPSSAAQADPFFKLQYKHPKYNQYGPLSSSNCGPASLAMVLQTLGLEPPNLNIENSIDHARYLMFPNDSRARMGEGAMVLDADSETSSNADIETGIRTAGGRAEPGSSWETLDTKLSEGKPVVSYGYLNDEWRQQFPARVGRGDVGHINAILGKTPDGKYIVADPMHEGGPAKMTRDQLSVFYKQTSNGVPRFSAFAR